MHVAVTGVNAIYTFKNVISKYGICLTAGVKYVKPMTIKFARKNLVKHPKHRNVKNGLS